MGYIRLEPEGQFEPVPCPWCGFVENLEVSITGNWECDSCKREFWITPMRFYSGEPPVLLHDRNGKPIGWQLPLSYLALFAYDAEVEGDADQSGS